MKKSKECKHKFHLIDKHYNKFIGQWTGYFMCEKCGVVILREYPKIKEKDK